MARFTLPRDIYHGKGCLEELKNLKGKKAFLVVGGGSMKRQGFLDKAVNYLKEGGMEVQLIEGVEPDPSVETVMKGAKVMQEFQPDWIVAMGGGSPIDAAKAMWTFYEYPDTKFEDLITPFGFPELRQKAKFAAIPSTSGTATEVTAFSVITNYQTGVKYPLADFNITPDVAIVDPDLVMGLPVKQVAYTGMDALTHAMEAFLNLFASRSVQNASIEAVCENFHALPEAWRDGSRLAARQEMLHASYLAGFAFTNNFVGYVHAIAHAVGALYHIPHGRANAVLLPAVLREYGSCIAPKLAVLADALSLGGDTVSEKAERMIAAIEAMRDSFDIPSTLPHLSPNDYTEIARRALKEANPTYPVPQIWDSEKIFSVLRRVQS
mgnify:CR=1 FL=1